jgi:ElaB/YqjD/DUF883 family membrane-anchored ribosome-binding protein
MQNPYTKERELENEAREKTEKMKNTAESALNQGEQKVRGVAAEAEKKIKEGGEQVRQFVSDVDRQLHDNPWPLVTGIAASCLLLGFVMGITKK